MNLAFLQTPLVVVHVITAVFLVLVILVQPGKSGGLGAFSGAAATQVFGGRGAGNVLTRATWIATAIFFTTNISIAFVGSSINDSLKRRGAKPAASATAPAPVKK